MRMHADTVCTAASEHSSERTLRLRPPQTASDKPFALSGVLLFGRLSDTYRTPAASFLPAASISEAAGVRIRVCFMHLMHVCTFGRGRGGERLKVGYCPE